MRSSAISQIYGSSAEDSQVAAFLRSNFQQHALSLFNRGTSISAQFEKLFSREQFVQSYIHSLEDQTETALFSPLSEDQYLNELKTLWALCELRVKELQPCSEGQIAAALDVGTNLLAQKAAGGHERWPYLLLHANGGQVWGLCLSSDRKDVETWEIDEKIETFLAYAQGQR